MGISGDRNVFAYVHYTHIMHFVPQLFYSWPQIYVGKWFVFASPTWAFPAVEVRESLSLWQQGLGLGLLALAYYYHYIRTVYVLHVLTTTASSLLCKTYTHNIVCVLGFFFTVKHAPNLTCIMYCSAHTCARLLLWTPGVPRVAIAFLASHGPKKAWNLTKKNVSVYHFFVWKT